MFYIYRITNLINGKTYIGQHKYKNLNDSYMGSGKYLKAAQKKYGIENFKKDILVFSIVEKSFIDLLEKEYIKFYRSLGKAEYNIADGGQGGNLGLEVNKKIAEAHKGKKQSEETIRKKIEANTGKRRSEETKRKIAEANTGKHHSEETKKKLSELGKGRIPWNKGKHTGPMSEETKRKQREAHKGKKPNRNKKHWKLIDEKRVWY